MGTIAKQSMLFPDMVVFFESNSPKNRKKLYSYLEKRNINYNTEIIGYTTGKKDLCRWTKHGRKIG